ncbi:hypothetical protein RFI_00655, partial [Reticulomyxa filosa]
ETKFKDLETKNGPAGQYNLEYLWKGGEVKGAGAVVDVEEEVEELEEIKMIAVPIGGASVPAGDVPAVVSGDVPAVATPAITPEMLAALSASAAVPVAAMSREQIQQQIQSMLMEGIIPGNLITPLMQMMASIGMKLDLSGDGQKKKEEASGGGAGNEKIDASAGKGDVKASEEADGDAGGKGDSKAKSPSPSGGAPASSGPDGILTFNQKEWSKRGKKFIGKTNKWEYKEFEKGDNKYYQDVLIGKDKATKPFVNDADTAGKMGDEKKFDDKKIYPKVFEKIKEWIGSNFMQFRWSLDIVLWYFHRILEKATPTV